MSAWDYGVSSAPCDSCGETTIVRSFDEPDGSERWLCRPCWTGENDDLRNPGVTV